ncbi:MAG: serine protease [Rhodospirillales bacterium]
MTFKNAFLVLLAPALMGLMLTAGCTRLPVKVDMVENKAPVTIKDPAELAPIKLQRVGINIRRGTAIGVYKSNFVTCYSFIDNVFWNQGRVLGRDTEFEDLFYEEMKAANFNVVGNPKKMFAGLIRDELQPAYLIGAQVEEIKMEVCDHISIWSGLPQFVQSGKGSIKVQWQVFSPFTKKVVYETITKGMADIETPSANGEMIILNESFAAASSNLAADEEFVALLMKDWRTNLDIRAVDEVELRVLEQKSYTSPIQENIDLIRFGVVTIETGLGHGSGVFISPTLIMTNHHVIEGQEIVRVVLTSGRKILGEVVRKHPERDVALVQVEDSGHQPVPMRMRPLKMAEDIYAVGAPWFKELSGTVTKGIVSKFSSNRYGLEDIQADVDIQPGNSGGPLLDGNGNLVALSYAGIGDITVPGSRASIGINFFIPIYDAVDKLKITMRKRKRVESPTVAQ